MNVRCPECFTMYRVDPAKVTHRVRARCGECSGVLTIEAVEEPRELAPQASPRHLDQGPGDEGASQTSPQLDPDTQATPPAPLSLANVRAPHSSAHLAPDTDVTQPARLGLADVQAPQPSPQLDEGSGDERQTTRQPGETVESSEEAAQPAAHVSPPFVQPRTAPQAPAPTQPNRPSAPVFRPTPGMPVQATPARPPAPSTARIGSEDSDGTPDGGAVGVASTPEVVTGPDSPTPVNPFLSRDPRERARRLARALVSDIIVYQPKKRRQALQDGTLRDAFREEIGRSWKEYRQQMGEEFASSTPYFTEALNEILAEGRQIF